MLKNLLETVIPGAELQMKVGDALRSKSDEAKDLLEMAGISYEHYSIRLHLTNPFLETLLLSPLLREPGAKFWKHINLLTIPYDLAPPKTRIDSGLMTSALPERRALLDFCISNMSNLQIEHEIKAHSAYALPQNIMFLEHKLAARVAKAALTA